MKGTVLFYDKIDQEKAEKMADLGLPPPKPGTVQREVYLSKDHISAAYLSDNGIVVFLPSGEWVFEYDKELWDKIKAYLND